MNTNQDEKSIMDIPYDHLNKSFVRMNKGRRIKFLNIGVFIIVAISVFLIFKALKVESETFSYNDGPYIFYLNDSIIKTIDIKESAPKFTIHEYEFNIRDTLQLNRKIGVYNGFNPLEKFEFSAPAEFNATKIAAISDVHGSFHHFKELLMANSVVDKSLNWTWGNGHLVIVGDVFDKGSYVSECLWLIRKLEVQAEKQGGKVHFLLGNHEMLILTGNANYIGLKYRDICKQVFINYSQFFTPDTYMGRWLRSKNVVVKINNNLFTHGGISTQMVDKQCTLTEINKAFNTSVNLKKSIMNYDLKTRSKLSFVNSYYGPLEYRGYFNKNIFNRGQATAFPDSAIDRIIKYYNVDHIVVGHTIVRKIKGLFNNKVIAINNRFPEDDLVDKKSHCEMLIIEGAYYYKAELSGAKTLLFSDNPKL